MEDYQLPIRNEEEDDHEKFLWEDQDESADPTGLLAKISHGTNPNPKQKKLIFKNYTDVANREGDLVKLEVEMKGNPMLEVAQFQHDFTETIIKKEVDDYLDQVEADPLAHLAPKAKNPDLKKQLESKLEPLNLSTQKALVEYLRETKS